MFYGVPVGWAIWYLISSSLKNRSKHTFKIALETIHRTGACGIDFSSFWGSLLADFGLQDRSKKGSKMIHFWTGTKNITNILQPASGHRLPAPFKPSGCSAPPFQLTDVGFDCQCGLGVGRNWTWNLPKTGPKINDVLDRLLDLIIGLSVAIPSWAPFNLNLGQLWNHSGSQDGFQLGFGADFAFQKRSQNQPKFTENLLWHSTWLLTRFRHNFSNCCWIFPLPLFLKLFLRPHTAH